MYEKVQEVVDRYNELSTLLSSPDIGRTPDLIREYSVEQAGIADMVRTYRRYQQLTAEIEKTLALLDEEEDEDMRTMISDEVVVLQEALEPVESELKLLIAPKDPRDRRDVIIEIRAGAGGDEAGLFAGDLFRMYSVYATNNGWTVEILSTNETGIGGYKEIIFEVKGRGAFSRFKFESGVHRVQRVPVTESSGRIHTSTATVAVLPQVDDVDVEVLDSDLRIDVYRASGKGGQGVNTTDSAVRITHVPTGIVAQCQDERSQLQNKLRAMTILRARLYDVEFNRQMDEIGASRRQQVGSGERAEKIRTYNFPQSRVTDHRIHLTVYQLESILAGQLDSLIDPLLEEDQAERLAEQGG